MDYTEGSIINEKSIPSTRFFGKKGIKSHQIAFTFKTFFSERKITHLIAIAK
jgi:hypothetical protein